MAKKNKKIKSFNYVLQVVVPIGIMVFIVVLLFITIAFLSRTSDKGVGDYMPDVLGGFFGVIFGFLFDSLVVYWFKRLSRYKTLVKLLNTELTDIMDVCISNLEKIKGTKEVSVYTINQPILEDIMDSSDNLALFNGKCSGMLLEYIRRINALILRTNNNEEGCADVDECKKVYKKLYQEIIIYAYYVGVLTNYIKNNSMKAKKGNTIFYKFIGRLQEEYILESEKPIDVAEELINCKNNKQNMKKMKAVKK